MGYSGVGGKLIHEKNPKQKISWHCPFTVASRSPHLVALQSLESADCGLKNKEKLAETIDQPTRSMGNTLYTIYG
jgi:hypothetical protein